MSAVQQQPPPPRRVTNVGSLLLTPQENESLFTFLGKKCVTMSSAVVQLYAADRNCMWSKKCSGVACLVKDNPQRSYFLRIFDIKDGKLLWEQELYNNFVYNSPRGYFHTFAGDTCQVALNFANEEEAKKFRKAVTDLLGRRQRKSEKRRDPPNGPNLPMATVDIKNPEITTNRFYGSQVNNISHTKEKKKGKAKKKRLTKADIGTPSNFQHIGHVGWDPNTGFDLNNLDPELKNLFDMCGISEAQLKDRETSKVIYDFIEKTGGVEAVKNELRRQGLLLGPGACTMNPLLLEAISPSPFVALVVAALPWLWLLLLMWFIVGQDREKWREERKTERGEKDRHLQTRLTAHEVTPLQVGSQGLKPGSSCWSLCLMPRALNPLRHYCPTPSFFFIYIFLFVLLFYYFLNLLGRKSQGRADKEGGKRDDLLQRL
ncbi:actin nucleation-promoting factor WASL isoform X3 [Erinaceus europaeus]|uniref:Actin nucleation-promoting factor WASL isoform X3 n=1 Tax=Erinaceus europaeus TaxID=9365 RepID=A0ABM3XUJ8_ERIEU|nr:actin nucleation-promoting factor WASL isoform X3 [Erinaceus europaeus]